MRIVVKSMIFSPVGAVSATAAQDEQSILHDWHSTEHYGTVRSAALTWISDGALDTSSRPVEIDSGYRDNKADRQVRGASGYGDRICRCVTSGADR